MSTENNSYQCRRCGTCCSKGGPALHYPDKALIESGIIGINDIYTLRRGELAFDNVKGKLEPLQSECIKIKGKNNTWMCRFYDEENNTCRIYQNRPVECQALSCWDTREIEGMYDKDRLTRKNLISENDGLWRLIEAHEQRCDYMLLTNLIKQIDSDSNDESMEKILNIILYDANMRPLIVEKTGLEPAFMDFFFGRPLAETIRMYGLKMETNGEEIRLAAI